MIALAQIFLFGFVHEYLRRDGILNLKDFERFVKKWYDINGNRRLYDIVNVLIALEILQKHSVYSKKFQWSFDLTS